MCPGNKFRATESDVTRPAKALVSGTGTIRGGMPSALRLPVQRPKTESLRAESTMRELTSESADG